MTEQQTVKQAPRSRADAFGMPSYHEYQNSGLEWIGRIPSHWDVTRLKYLCERVADYGENIPSDNYQNEGVRFLRTTDINDDGSLSPEEPVYVQPTEVQDSLLETGDLLLSRSGTLGQSFLYNSSNHEPAAYAGYLVRFTPKDHIASKFLYYYTKSASFSNWIRVEAIESTIGNVSGRKYANAYVPVPPEEEQNNIASFLDGRIGRIDELIAKKRRLIELLEEKRTALITRAVTKGLDLDVPMKDSGVEWLGKVPEHWDVLSLDRITSHKCDGPFGSSLKSEHYRDNGVRVIRLQNIGWCEFIDDDRAYISEEYYEENLGDHGARPGDVLISALGDENKPAGRACPVPDDIGPAIVKADCFRFRLREEWADERFVAYQLSATADAASSALARGATRKRMTLGSVGKRTIALPPLSEQREIVSYLRREEEELRRAVDAVKHGVKLLAEYREVLVTYAVTGKIDVRDHAA